MLCTLLIFDKKESFWIENQIVTLESELDLNCEKPKDSQPWYLGFESHNKVND